MTSRDRCAWLTPSASSTGIPYRSLRKGALTGGSPQPLSSPQTSSPGTGMIGQNAQRSKLLYEGEFTSSGILMTKHTVPIQTNRVCIEEKPLSNSIGQLYEQWCNKNK